MSVEQEKQSGAAAARGLQSATGLGIACIMGNGLLLALNDSVAKWVGASLPVGELIVIRGAFALALIFGFLAVTRQVHLLRIKNLRAMALYAFTMVVATHLFLHALQLMPLADAVAITFISPIITTVLAIPFLGEKVGWRRWVAVLIGFVGVIVLLWPSGQGYTLLAAALPLGCAVMVSVRDVVSRQLSKTDASVAILFHNTLAVAVSGFLELPFVPWVMPTSDSVLLLVLAALLLGSAQYLIVEAYRFAELSLLMPFRYTTLIFSAVAGYVIWLDVPTWNVVAGAAIIVFSGLFIWYREQVRRPR